MCLVENKLSMNIGVKNYVAVVVNKFFTNQMLTVFLRSILTESVFNTHS